MKRQPFLNPGNNTHFQKSLKIYIHRFTRPTLFSLNPSAYFKRQM